MYTRRTWKKPALLTHYRIVEHEVVQRLSPSSCIGCTVRAWLLSGAESAYGKGGQWYIDTKHRQRDQSVAARKEPFMLLSQCSDGTKA